MTWHLIPTLLIAWLVQNTIHEVSHLLAGWIFEGRKPLGLWPYPHRYQGRWYFARYRSGPAKRSDPTATRHIVPFYAGLIWITVSLFAAVLLPEHLWLYCMPFTLCATVDALFFWWGFYWGSPESDGQRYRGMVDR
jgi:hypothetical protein